MSRHTFNKLGCNAFGIFQVDEAGFDDLLEIVADEVKHHVAVLVTVKVNDGWQRGKLEQGGYGLHTTLYQG